MSTALRDKATRWIVALYATVALLDWATSLALVLAAYGASGKTTVAAAVLFGLRVGPALLLPFLGARLDAIPMRRSLAGAALVQGAALATIGAVGAGWVSIALGAVVGTATALERAQLRAALAKRTDGLAFRGGSALINSVGAASSLMGPALSGASVALMGAEASLLVLGGASVVLAAAIATRSRQLIGPAAALSGGSEGTSTADGEDRVVSGLPRRRASVAALLALTGASAFAFSMDEPMMLAYADRALNSAVVGFSVINVVWGAGLVLGTFALGRFLNSSMIRVYAVATLVIVIAHVAMSAAPTLLLAAAAALIGGFGNGMDWAALSVAVQEAAPRGREAAVAARLEAVATGAPALGILAGGVLADQMSARTALLVPAAIGATIVVAALAVQRLAAPSRRTVTFPHHAQLAGGTG